MFLGVLGNKTLRSQLDKEFNKVAPTYFLYGRSKRSGDISEVLREKYLPQPIRKKQSFLHLNKVSVAPQESSSFKIPLNASMCLPLV